MRFLQLFFTFSVLFCVCFSLQATPTDSLIRAYQNITTTSQKTQWLTSLIELDMPIADKRKMLNTLLDTDSENEILQAQLYAKTGFLESEDAKFPDAIEAYEKALLIQKKANVVALDTLADRWKMSLARVFHSIGEYQKAYTLLMEILKNVEKENNKLLIADISKQIGDVHRSLKNEDKAIIYYQRALDIYKEERVKRGEASTSNSLGILYSDQQNPYKALEFYRRTLQICQEIDFENGISFTLNNIGYELFVLSNYDSAYYYYEQSLKLKEKSGNSYSMASTLVNMGQVRLAQKDYQEAKRLFEKSLALAKSTQNSEVELENYEFLTKLYQETAKPAQALEYLQNYVKLKERIFEEGKLEKINELEARFQAGKKEQQIQFLQQQAEWEEGKIYLLSGLVFLAVIVLILLFRRIRGKQQANLLLSQKNDEITRVNQKVMESITYAKHIQDAIQVNATEIFEHFPTHFIINKPKDIVGGDCLWFAQHNTIFYLALADCTGHGVAGAFMTILCNSLLNDIFTYAKLQDSLLSPAQVLEKLDDLLQEYLHQKQTNIKDGMDIALLQIDTSINRLGYAGAKIPLYYQLPQQQQLACIKATRRPIGEQQFKHKRTAFENVYLDIQKGMQIYLASDGYQDQFGGDQNRKLLRKNFENILHSNDDLYLTKNNLLTTLEKWKGDQDQTDDIMVLGIEL